MVRDSQVVMGSGEDRPSAIYDKVLSEEGFWP